MEDNFDKIKRILAMNIISLRKQRKLSQEKLAELCGLHRTYIGAVERAERNVTLKTLFTISNALDVSIASLITEKKG